MPQSSWRLAAGAAMALCVAAGLAAQTPPPAPLDGWRIADHVTDGAVVLLSEGGALYVPIREFDAPRTSASRPYRAAPILEMPPALTSQLVANKAHIGDPWTIDSSTAGRFHAVVDHFVLGYKNCGEAWGVFLRPIPPDEGRFLSVGSVEYIAHPGAIFATSSRTVGELSRSLTEPERGELSMLLEQARRQTIGGVRHQWAQGEPQRLANPALRDFDAKWTELDKGLDRMDARLSFEARLYRVTPDGDPRVFVQARWTVHGFVAYALTMWARVSGMRLTVDSVDASPALLVRTPEMESTTIDRTTSQVLGLFDVNADGRAEVLLVRPGYESIDRDLIEYPSAAGAPPRTIAHYADGC